MVAVFVPGCLFRRGKRGGEGGGGGGGKPFKNFCFLGNLPENWGPPNFPKRGGNGLLVRSFKIPYTRFWVIWIFNHVVYRIFNRISAVED